jgi:hypothetical protein
MFLEMPAQILALIRSRQMLPTRLVNIEGRPVLVPKTNSPRKLRLDSVKLAFAFAAIYLV